MELHLESFAITPLVEEVGTTIRSLAEKNGNRVLVECPVGLGTIPTVRELMERFLVKEGFPVVTAANGVEGLRRAREVRPAAITLDVLMPDLDGWTVLAALKGDPDLADIPVIFVTILDEKTRGYSLGATDYLVKPVDRERLAHVLKRICGDRPSRRLLLVEDDETTRMVIQHALERDGWSITQAANGRAALARIAEQRPDAILLEPYIAPTKPVSAPAPHSGAAARARVPGFPLRFPLKLVRSRQPKPDTRTEMIMGARAPPAQHVDRLTCPAAGARQTPPVLGTASPD